MNGQLDHEFWDAMADLATSHRIVIDRPKGQPHPNWPPNSRIYPLNYGYLEGTSATDGGGIDVWLGSLQTRALTGILCTFDTLKRDAELKLLLGCTATDVQDILAFHGKNMKALYIPNPKEHEDEIHP